MDLEALGGVIDDCIIRTILTIRPYYTEVDAWIMAAHLHDKELRWVIHQYRLSSQEALLLREAVLDAVHKANPEE